MKLADRTVRSIWLTVWVRLAISFEDYTNALPALVATALFALYFTLIIWTDGQVINSERRFRLPTGVINFIVRPALFAHWMALGFMFFVGFFHLFFGGLLGQWIID